MKKEGKEGGKGDGLEEKEAREEEIKEGRKN